MVTALIFGGSNGRIPIIFNPRITKDAETDRIF
jgi:hypothetical protein